MDIERYYNLGKSEVQIGHSLPWLLIPAPLETGSPEGTLASGCVLPDPFFWEVATG
ncbi:MAG: hypothetical protein OSA95_06865 [Opitutales bacterium]|nr:hypothetical protein [Opitutales bacterium]